MRCEWLQLIIVWEWGRPLRTISVRETRLSYRTTKDCQTCLHYKPSSFALLGGVLKQYIWLELEMLVVQTYTAESGVCSTCFGSALYWNKDCCIRNKETSFISYTSFISQCNTGSVSLTRSSLDASAKLKIKRTLKYQHLFFMFIYFAINVLVMQFGFVMGNEI